MGNLLFGQRGHDKIMVNAVESLLAIRKENEIERLALCGRYLTVVKVMVIFRQCGFLAVVEASQNLIRRYRRSQFNFGPTPTICLGTISINKTMLAE